MISTTYAGPNRWENIGTTFGMTLQDVIDYGYDLHLDAYPIWDEGYRDWLNGLIVAHFRLREIRAETPLLFCMWLDRLMRENMPYINPLFEALQGSTLDSLRESWYRTRHEDGTRHDTMTDTSEGSSTSEGTNVTDETTRATASDEASGTSAGSGHNYASTNPKQTMIGKVASDYYDSGTFADTSSMNSSSNYHESSDDHDVSLASSMSESYESSDQNVTDGSDSRDIVEHGFDRSMLDVIRAWRDLRMNPIQMVFDALEPAFCQLYTTHFNCF